MGADETLQIRDLEQLNNKYRMNLDQQLWAAKHNKYSDGFKPDVLATPS